MSKTIVKKVIVKSNKGKYTVYKYSVVLFVEEEVGKLFECIPDLWFVDETRTSCYWPPKTGKSFLLRAIHCDKPGDDWEVWECSVVSGGYLTYNAGFKVVKEKCSQKYNTSSADEHEKVAQFRRQHPGLVDENIEHVFAKPSTSNDLNEKPVDNQCEGSQIKPSPENAVKKVSSSVATVDKLVAREGRNVKNSSRKSNNKTKRSTSSSTDSIRSGRRKKSASPSKSCGSEKKSKSRSRSSDRSSASSNNQLPINIQQDVSGTKSISDRQNKSRSRSIQSLSSRSRSRQPGPSRSRSISSRSLSKQPVSRQPGPSRSRSISSRPQSKQPRSRQPGPSRSRSISSRSLSKQPRSRQPGPSRSRSISSRSLSKQPRSRQPGPSRSRSISSRSQIRQESRSRQLDSSRSPSIQSLSSRSRSRQPRSKQASPSRSRSISSRSLSKQPRSRQPGPSRSRSISSRSQLRQKPRSFRSRSSQQSRSDRSRSRQSRRLWSSKSTSNNNSGFNASTLLYNEKAKRHSTQEDNRGKKLISSKGMKVSISRNNKTSKRNGNSEFPSRPSFRHSRSNSRQSRLYQGSRSKSHRPSAANDTRQDVNTNRKNYNTKNDLPYSCSTSSFSIQNLMADVKELTKVVREKNNHLTDNDRRLNRMEVTINKIFLMLGDMNGIGHVPDEPEDDRFNVPKLPILRKTELFIINRQLKDKEFGAFLLNHEKKYCCSTKTSTDNATVSKYLKRFISVDVRCQLTLKEVGPSGITLFGDYHRVYLFLIDVIVTGHKIAKKKITVDEAHTALRIVWGRSKQLQKESNNN